MGFWEIISWIAVGFCGGALGKLLLPGKDPGGWFITILLGIAGALLGGFLTQYLPIPKPEAGFKFYNLVVAIGGTIVILLAYRLVKK